MDVKEIINILACPACHGDLDLLENNGATSGLACAACKVVYPVEDGIAIMLVDKAVRLGEWSAEGDQQCES